MLSGAAFQKNRLSSTSSAHSTLFEDDYVASLLDADADGVLTSLARVTGESAERCTQRLRHLAFGFFHERSRRREGYPRLHVVEGYQAAGLTLLRDSGGEIGRRAGIVLDERFPGTHPTRRHPPAGFPGPDAGPRPYDRVHRASPAAPSCGTACGRKNPSPTERTTVQRIAAGSSAASC